MFHGHLSEIINVIDQVVVLSVIENVHTNFTLSLNFWLHYQFDYTSPPIPYRFPYTFITMG